MSVARCRPAASGRRPRAGLLVGLVVLVSACASAPPTPAPVENRTRPQAPAPRPAAAAGSAPAPAPAPAPARPAPVPAPAPAAAAPVRPREPAVQTAPVRPGSVEARPLPPPPSPSNLLREPRVTKRPFSDAALAEMRAADAAAGGAADAAGTTPPPAGAPATGMASGAAVPPPPAGTPPASAPAAERPGPVGNIELDWPLRGAILQGFGEGRSTGLAIAASAGDPILAAGDGRVIFSGPGPRGYGNLIIIKHDADLLSVYGHGRTLLVKEGQTVRKGQRIAEAGDSGTDRPRLLFEIRRGGKPVDPAGLLPPR